MAQDRVVVSRIGQREGAGVGTGQGANWHRIGRQLAGKGGCWHRVVRQLAGGRAKYQFGFYRANRASIDRHRD